MAIAQNFRFQNSGLTLDKDVTRGLPPNAVAFDGFQSAEWTKQGTTTDLASDASELIQQKPVSGIDGALTLVLLNQEQFKDVDVGDVIQAVIRIEQVRDGRGAVTGNDKIVTIPRWVVTSVRSGVQGVAGETLTITGEIVADANGDLVKIADAP